MLLEDAKGDPDTEDCIKWASTGIFLGQMDTVRPISVSSVLPLTTDQTTSALSWFFLAMALHPEVQAKAQTEIDKVIGNERLPRAEDRNTLPYISAVMQEVLRWHPVVPLSMLSAPS